MSLTPRWTGACLVFFALFAGSVIAATPEDDEMKKCVKPKFRDFEPAPMAEVLPESDIAFHVTHNMDPLSVTAEARGEKMKVKVTDKTTFYLVTAKLPKLTGGFARIHLTAMAAEGKAVRGGCLGQDGWLLKIKGDEAAASQPAAQ